MSQEEQQRKKDQIQRILLERIHRWINTGGGSFDLVVTSNGYSYDLGDGWNKLTSALVDVLAEQKVIDLNKSDCSCDLAVLMGRGCLCGEALYEKLKKGTG